MDICCILGKDSRILREEIQAFVESQQCRRPLSMPNKYDFLHKRYEKRMYEEKQEEERIQEEMDEEMQECVSFYSKNESNTPFPPLYTLRKVRLQKRVTQRILADYLGVTMQYYSQIERGLNTLSYYNALRLAVFFSTSVDALFKQDYLRFDEQLDRLDKR